MFNREPRQGRFWADAGWRDFDVSSSDAFALRQSGLNEFLSRQSGPRLMA